MNLPRLRGTKTSRHIDLGARARWGRGVGTIYQFFRHLSLNPEEVEKLATAYEGALDALQLSNRTDRIAKIIAERIIEAAKTGERDPTRLCEAAIKDLRVP